MKLRQLAGQYIPKALRRYVFPPWAIAQSQPDEPRPLKSVQLYAVVAAWMEADIIEATISNAFVQGADRVFLIDNDSPDDTVQRAQKAGAELSLTYKTSTYDEDYRINIMNEFVRHTSMSSNAEHLWWLWLDADEFPRPQSGGTIRNMLASLDRRFRVVGARFLNHYPSPRKVAYMQGQHPIDYQPLCEELKSSMCLEGHRKHPLIRWDSEGPEIISTKGFHVASCSARPLFEPVEPLIIHHFPYRNEEATRQRMHQLWSPLSAGCSRAKHGDLAVTHMKTRLDSLDAVYAGDWESVKSLYAEEPRQGVSVSDWREVDPLISADIPRWYSPRH